MYVNRAKNAGRLGASTVLRSSLMKQSPVLKRGMTDSFNNSMINP